MRAPGACSYGALVRALSGPIRERVFDPIVADTQLEAAAARSRGRRAQAAWIHARGHTHLLEALALVLALAVLESARRGLCRFGAALALAALLTFGLYFGLATLTRDAALRELSQAAPQAPAPRTSFQIPIRAQAPTVR